MKDDIKLPPLPEIIIRSNPTNPRFTVRYLKLQDAINFTKEAIKADRQQRGGEPVDPPGDNFGSAEHWKEKAQYWAAEAHKLRQQALRGEPVDGIVPPAAPDNFERAQSIVSKWPGWKRNYVLVKPTAPKFGEEE